MSDEQDDAPCYDEAASKEMLAAVWGVFDEVRADSDIDVTHILSAIGAASAIERRHLGVDCYAPDAFDVVASVLWARIIGWEMDHERLDLAPSCKGAGPLLALARVAVALEAMSAAESSLTDACLFGSGMTRAALRIAERNYTDDEAEA